MQPNYFTVHAGEYETPMMCHEQFAGLLIYNWVGYSVGQHISDMNSEKGADNLQ